MTQTMSNKLVISLLAILFFCGCQKETIQNEITPTGDGASFTAVIEDEFPNTKTSVDSEGNVLWKKGDQVSIFAGSTNNDKYQVTDASDGKGSAELVPVSTGSGNDIDNNVALYPYQSTASITKSGDNYTISNITLPSIQPYAEGSFGNGAFPMVAVTSSTSDKSLKFKNIFGVLKLQLKGTANIVSIQITGNNNEILCGAASVTVSNGSTPTVSLTSESAKTVILDCGTGVQLNNETATPFLIAFPPITMASGFTVVVKDSEGKQMEIKTIKEQTITRSNILKMPVKDYVGVAKPLTFTSTGSTEISLCKVGTPYDITLEYKVNDGEWASYTIGTSIPLNDKDQVSFQAGSGGNPKFSSSSYPSYYNFKFLGVGKIIASGNIMSLVDQTMETLTIPDKNYFSYLFYKCTALTTAPDLPATTIADNCYYEMFSGCTLLTKAPKLPATTLATGCYSGMFVGCTSLSDAHDLPATTLAKGCYGAMFNDCSSLTKAPVLPATTLAVSCYQRMFTGCTSLTKAPKLPATTLTQSCYRNMFGGCTSLTTVPNLPATTMTDYCYCEMFKGCTSLTSTSVMPATTLATCCYDNMFSGCTSLIKAPELPAVSLAKGCYSKMFEGCTSLITPPSTLPATTMMDDCCWAMFYNCTSLTTSPDLPATTLAAHCYNHMFCGCTSLTAASELPATTLAVGCYLGMFDGCVSLPSAPDLPSTTMEDNCYMYMFDGCTSLTTAPDLPATTLAKECYQWMFCGCTSLTTAPDLPATVLAEGCYGVMFDGCTSLTTAPELPATTLANGCYTSMFYKCSKLNYVKALFTSTPSDTYTSYWMYGVASSGTFVKSKDATWNVTGVNGIPSGWTVQTE